MVVNRWLIAFLLIVLHVQGLELVAQNRIGQDRALFFAADNYLHYLNLDNPIANVQKIAAVLKERYGFITEIIPNPTYDAIENKLHEYDRAYREGKFETTGQLLIFLSGHGVSQGNNGYFLPTDAEPFKAHRTALEYDHFRNLVNQIDCQHLLVVIDACHSISFDPAYPSRGGPDLSRPGERYDYRMMTNYEIFKGRWFFTSDGKDEQTPDNSSFAEKFLEGLNNRGSQKGYLTSSSLYADFLKWAFPVPAQGPFGDNDHESCFIFFEEASSSIPPQISELEFWNQVKLENTLAAYRRYLTSYPNGRYREIAESKLLSFSKQEEELKAWERTKSLNTILDYQNFIDSFPSSQFTVIAEDSLDSLRKRLLPKVPKVDLVEILAGKFTMGGKADYINSANSREVLVNNFLMARFEVTLAEYKRYCLDTGTPIPYDEQRGEKDLPAVNVSWYDAINYCNWLSKIEALQAVYTIRGKSVQANFSANGYRLPTEAEWEKVASFTRTKEKAFFGNGQQKANVLSLNFDASIRHELNSSNYPINRRETVPVHDLDGSANELNVHHLSGNVQEWCWDWYEDQPYSYININPRGPDQGTRKVVKGGAFTDDARGILSNSRKSYYPEYKGRNLGFRLVRSHL